VSAKTADEVRWFEYDWLACDGAGHVGFFSTAGGGHAPTAFLEDTDAHEAAIDAISSLPPSTSASCTRQLAEGLVDTWKQMALRGLYAFDSSVHGNPYRKVASPNVSIHVAALPEHIATTIRLNHFPRLRFADLEEVTPAMLG
jgi:hypothetical protein